MTEQDDKKVTITKRATGPIRIVGEVILKDEEGNQFETKPAFSLCGCGRSQKMPFCDGMHKKPVE